MAPAFRDRADAGRRLAALLTAYADRPDVLVLGLPRGGIPVAAEVAAALHAPLDALVVRKVGAPTQPELAMGAVASGGIRVLNDEVVRAIGAAPGDVARATARAAAEVERRERGLRGKRPPLDVSGRTVIVVDDGLATGSTMRAALAALRTRSPARLVVAVPVAPAATVADLEDEADEIVCVLAPEDFVAVGSWYADFSQGSDAEVAAVLRAAG